MFTKQDAADLADRMSGSLKIMNEIEFSDVEILAPDINLYQDENQYYDPGKNEIHLGIYGILSLFSPKDEGAFLSALNYIRGHESQHRRSTVSKCYSAAISRGVHAVIKYIQQKVEGTSRRFRNEQDYIDCTEDLKNKHGLYISWNMVEQIVAGVANSLEDGRIERIRSNRFPGFGNLRIVHRGIFWEGSSKGNYPEYDELLKNPAEHLRILVNDILMLATCQLHSRGFVMAYGGTPVFDEVKAFMPHIAKAVMSGSARGLIDPMSNICDMLAPYVLEACKMSKEDAEMAKALEDMLKEIVKSMLEKGEFQFDLSENDEDADDGSANSAFPQSDLVITLSDEEYDKLTENTNQKEGSGGGLFIRREHPKEEETKPEDEKGGNGGGGDNADENAGKEDGQSGGSSGEKGENSDENKAGKSGKDSEKTGAGSESKGGSGENGEQNGSESGSSAGSGAGKEGGKDGEKDTGKDAGKEGDADGRQKTGNPKSEMNRPGTEKKSSVADRKNSQAEKHVGKDVMDAAEKAVKEAMKEAAAQTRTEAEKNLENANINTAANKKAMQSKERVDTSKPISPQEMKDICSFKELKRAYKVKDNLPSVLAQRGKILKRKNEQYFKSLSTPNVSYLESGSIDAGRLYALSFGDTEVFRRQGKDKKFDGCAYVLVDNSGSMMGEKRTEACKAAAVIEEGFKGIMPMKIVAFDEQGCIIHEVIKGWDESLNKNCCWNFCLHGRNGCGNEDGYDIQVATRELMARPEKNKLLLVLSDGTPGNTEYCRKAIDHARKQGIQVTGIYFEVGACNQNRDFAYMYQKDYVCCALNELDENLTKVFKKFSRQ